jgi:WD40 repeat protein
VAFSPDGRFLLTGSWDSTARLWDAATGQQLRSFKVPPAWVTSAAFSPDGHFVVTGSNDGIARLWDAATGKNVHSFDAHIGASPNIPVHVAYSPDGHFLLTGSDDLTGSGNQTLRLWDPVTGQKLRSFEGYAAGTDHTVVFSPDSRYILASSWGDETARLWDRVTGQELRSFKGHTSAAGPLAISSDGRYLLVGETMTK